tara:strand:+ start:11977 stop:14427 length:2451 start_codon:yes stop_codon:yes gene_type:complete
MARYDLPQYQSVYRDPQSVKINTILRQRYVENFAGADALQQSVDQMTSADFEGDKLEKENLVNQYNAELEEMSRQGDYERMGSRVASNARNFIQDYYPIQQNKAKYDAYIKSLDELRESGDISEFVYKRKQVQAKHGYYGLQRDEEGKIDEGSYFSGPGVAKSVDYIKVLDDALSGIKANAASTVFDIPQDQLVVDSKTGEINLQVMQEGGTMKYVVETTQGWKQVSSDRVARIVRDVLADPSVQMSLEQDADLSTFDINPDDAKIAVDNELAEIDKQILEAETQEEREELEEYKEDVLDKRAEEGDISLLRSLERNNIMNRAMDASQAKYVYLETEEKKLLDYDDIHKHNLTNQTNQYTPTANIYADASSQAGLGGDTYEKKQEYIATTQTVIDDAYDSLWDKQNTDLQNYDLQQIKEQIHNIQNAEEFEELAKNYNMTPENFRNEVNQILENESRVNLVKQKIEETKEIVKPKDDDYYHALTDNEGEITGQNIRDAFDIAVQVFNRNYPDEKIEVPEGANYHDMVRIINSQTKHSGTGSAYFGVVSDNILKDLMANYLLGTEDISNLLGSEYGEMKERMSDITKKYNKQVSIENHLYNREFKKDVKTDALIMRSFGTSDDRGKDNTKKVKAEFKSLFNDGIPRGFNIRTMDGSFEGDWAVYMKGDWWNKTAEYTVDTENIGMSNVPSPDGKHMLYVPITFTAGPEKGKKTYFLVDAAQIDNKELDDWTSSAEYQVQRMYARGEWANVDTYNPEMFNNVRFDYTNNKIYIDLPDDDTDKLIEHTKEEGLAVLANVYANLGYADLFNVIKAKRGRR